MIILLDYSSAGPPAYGVLEPLSDNCRSIMINDHDQFTMTLVMVVGPVFGHVPPDL